MAVIFSDKFEKAVDYVIKNEGGYVFDKDDLGGETKFGISKRSYPALNIKDLTLENAYTFAITGIREDLKKYQMMP